MIFLIHISTVHRYCALDISFGEIDHIGKASVELQKNLTKLFKGGKAEGKSGRDMCKFVATGMDAIAGGPWVVCTTWKLVN